MYTEKRFNDVECHIDITYEKGYCILWSLNKESLKKIQSRLRGYCGHIMPYGYGYRMRYNLHKLTEAEKDILII